MKKLAKTALVGSLVVAGVSPFTMNAMAQGYQNQPAKCAKSDKKCATQAKKANKKAEAKCGEGKCGGTAAAAGTTKKADAKCGEGKCGGTATTAPKTTEAKCGEGKCGGSK